MHDDMLMLSSLAKNLALARRHEEGHARVGRLAESSDWCLTIVVDLIGAGLSAAREMASDAIWRGMY